jgi:phage terminase small subunit
MYERTERTGITADRVLRELALIGFANMADYMSVGDHGHPCVDFSGLTRDQAAAIKEIRSRT